MPAEHRTTLTLLVDTGEEGEPVHEQVLVEPLGQDRYRLVATPGLVPGVAADDVIEVAPDGGPRVVTRGGNVAVQVFASDAAADEALAGFVALGGRMDGRIPDTLSVFTVPAASGFLGIQSVLEWLGARHPDAEWVFGNVFADDGVTPLDWWDPSVQPSGPPDPGSVLDSGG